MAGGSFDSQCQWVALSRGDPIPKNAVVVGFTKTDGKTWAGRHQGEVGKINADDGGMTMHNFWCHNAWTPSKTAEILCCSGSYSWEKIQKNQRIPDNALSASTTKTDGVCYVARFEGECGKLNLDKGRVNNFYGHSKGRRELCEVLVTGSPQDSSSTGDAGNKADARRLAAGYNLSIEAALPQEGDSVEPPKATEDSWRLRILQFNIWQEGTEVDGGFDQIVDVIIACEADIVTLSEVRNWNGDFHGRLKLALWEKGHTFYGDFVEGGDVGLLSRWPCKSMRQVCSAKAQRSFITAYEIQAPKKTICVCTAHLDWKQYALNLIRGYGGNTFMHLPTGPVTDIQKILEMDEDSGRGLALQEFEEFATKLVSEGTPVFLGGDFNECSHEDWTAATKDKFGHNGLVVPWQHSKILAGAGFQDAWRVLYPDPVTHLGATWPSVCSKQGKVTSWAKQADERDRIDFIYYSPQVFPKDAWLVGPDEYFVFGKAEACETQGPFFDAAKTLPWPSDHKGLLVDFEIPLLAAADEKPKSLFSFLE
jgi:endonuclease/exonuclease/phosphatase family metal-dependent hydrolase